MEKSIYNKKYLLIFLVLIIIINSFSACSFIAKKGSQSNQTNNTINQVNNTNIQKNHNVKKEIDNDITESIKKEKIVSNAEVGVFDNWIVTIIVLKKNAKQNEIKNFSNKYKALLKEKYQNKKILYQIFQNDKYLINEII